MIRYFNICKDYFKLKVTNKKLLTKMFICSILRNLVAILFPIFASKIVDYATIGEYSSAFTNLIYLGINYYIYDLVSHLHYIAYRDNTDYVYNKLQSDIIDKVSTYDENFTKNITKSYLINTTSSDIAEVCMFTDRMINSITHFIILLISLIIIIFSNIYIGLIVLVFNILYLHSLNINLKKNDYYFNGQRRQQDKISELFSQILDGNKEIKSFDMNKKLNEHLDIEKQEWTRQYKIKRIYWDRCNTTLPIILMIPKIISYLIIVSGILKGESTIGTLVFIIGYIDRVSSANDTYFVNINKVCNSSIRIDRLHNILTYYNKNMLEFGNNYNDNIYGNIEFKNVSFTYENNLILDDVTFNINRNSLTAIVGKSGSGKSTIFRLLLRLYKLEQGNIYIDGTNIYDYSKEIFPSNVSITTQRPFIFNMSIRENLNLVDSNKKRQIEACKRVGIHDFIMSLPDGYNTVLKEDATNISGGQKQLISLARTLLSKAEILLFDEITSSLDPNTTNQVINVLKDLKNTHTVIMITHKPKLMKLADNIIVIHKGKVVGNNNHKNLIQDNVYYQALQNTND